MPDSARVCRRWTRQQPRRELLRTTVIGTSIERRKQVGEFDDRMQVAIGMWNLINEKIPAPILKHWREIGVLLDAPTDGPYS